MSIRRTKKDNITSFTTKTIMPYSSYNQVFKSYDLSPTYSNRNIMFNNYSCSTNSLIKSEIKHKRINTSLNDLNKRFRTINNNNILKNELSELESKINLDRQNNNKNFNKINFRFSEKNERSSSCTLSRCNDRKLNLCVSHEKLKLNDLNLDSNQLLNNYHFIIKNVIGCQRENIIKDKMQLLLNDLNDNNVIDANRLRKNNFHNKVSMSINKKSEDKKDIIHFIYSAYHKKCKNRPSSLFGEDSNQNFLVNSQKFKFKDKIIIRKGVRKTYL